jgi:hypothetical protein
MFEILSQKKPVFGSKSLEKVFLNMRKLFYSKLSKNYEKMMLNLNFGNHEKLVPAQKFGMQGLNAEPL